MKKYIEFEEEICIEKYELSNYRITRTDYDFRCYRESRIYEDDTFWMEEQGECYCNIHITRIA